MATLDEDIVEKKFLNVSKTQDGIQTVSLWLIHHKVHHEKIVELWLKTLRKVTMKQRLFLFYVCNEVVQTCKRKHAVIYKDAFKTVLKDAVLLVRDNSIRPKIERIFGIWGERNIYDKNFVEELQELLANSTKVRLSATDSKLLAEFQPEKLVDMIKTFKSEENEVMGKKKLLRHLKMDASSLEAIRQLKDRGQGKEFCQQFEDSCVKLEDYASSVDKQLKDRSNLIEMLEHGQIFYDAQYSEAKIVANAYRNFGARVSNLKKKLDELKISLPDSESLVPSPSIKLPTPEKSPADAKNYVNMDLSNEDGRNFAQGSAQANQEDTTSISLPLPSITRIRLKAKAHRLAKLQQQQEQHQQQQQQEFSYTPKSDESAPSPEGSPVDLNIPGDDASPAKVPKIDAEPAKDTGSNIIFDMLQNLTAGTRTSSFTKTSSSSSTTNYSNNTESMSWQTLTANSSVSMDITPPSGVPTVMSSLRSEGEGTPMKDEVEKGSSLVKDEGSTDGFWTGGEQSSGLSTNPIEFLTQLINQTKNAAPGSSDFLQNLSNLTTSMKTLSGDSKDTANSSSTIEDNIQVASQSPSSWAEWKAQKDSASPLPASSPSQQQLATPLPDPAPTRELQQPPIPLPVPPPLSPMMKSRSPAPSHTASIPPPIPPPIQNPPASSPAVLQTLSPQTSMAVPAPPIPPPVLPPGILPLKPPPGPPSIIDTSRLHAVQPAWSQSPDGLGGSDVTTAPIPAKPLPPPVRPPILSSPTKGQQTHTEPKSPERDFTPKTLMQIPKWMQQEPPSNLAQIKTVSEPESEATISLGTEVTSLGQGTEKGHTPIDEKQIPVRYNEPLAQSPRPPLHPPGPPRRNKLTPSSVQSTEQQEFIEKLKRKSSVTSPPTLAGPPNFNRVVPNVIGGSNLRTLTQVPLVEKNKLEDIKVEEMPESTTVRQGSDQKDSLAEESTAHDSQTDTSFSENGEKVEKNGDIKDELARGMPIATIGATEPKMKSQVQKIVTVERRDRSDRKAEARHIESVSHRIGHADSRDMYSGRRPPHDRHGDYNRRDGHDPYRSRDAYYRDPYKRPYYPHSHRRY